MRKRLLIVDEDSASNSMLMNQLSTSKWVEVCGQATRIDQAWQMLQSLRPDLVLLGDMKESERGVICQQFRFAYPHLSFIAACSPQDLVWEPFYRNLGIWVIARPVHVGQLEGLAMMPQAMTKEVTQPPSISANLPLQQTMSEAPLPLQSPASHSNPKHFITVYGPKGGVGKTFISRELAIYFSQQKREGKSLKVLAVDFNLDLGTFATALNLPRTPNLFTWVQDIEAQLHESVRRYGRDPAQIRAEEWQEYIADIRLSATDIEKFVVTHVESGLHVLTSPRDIRHSFEIRNDHVYLILEALKHSTYDVILIDTAPDTTDATIQALFFAEQVVMVGNPVVDSIENIQRLLKLLREADYPEERIQVCMNRLQRKEMFTLEEIRAYFQLHPSKKIFPIPDDAEVKKSINTGSPMMLQPGKTAAKGAIEALGKALIPEAEEKSESTLKNKTRERSALFRWLWG